MTAPFIPLAPRGVSVFPSARPRTNADAGTAGPLEMTNSAGEFSFALTIAMLFGPGIIPAAQTSDARDAKPSNATDSSVAKDAPSDADRSAINALRSFVEHVAGARPERTPPMDGAQPSHDGTPPLQIECAAAVDSDKPASDEQSAQNDATHAHNDATRIDAPAPHGIPHGAPLDALRASAAVDPSLVVRDLSALQPEMRVRVERVITRMEQETGHQVTVAETWRSQPRQDYLHAQGRTRAGSIVTWTEHSRHSDGLGADLLIDGGKGDDVAYVQLRRIAAEEGLHTLGARDPGHVELVAVRGAVINAKQPVPRDANMSPATAQAVERVMTAAAQPKTPAEPRVPQESGVARVAQVAQVANVATVAPVAAVASAGYAAASAPAQDTEAAPAPRARTKAPARETQNGNAASDAAAPRTAPALRDGMAAPRTREASAAASVGFTPGVDTASRAERVHALQDSARSGLANGLVLRLEGADGSDERVRVDVRGRQVGARIDVPELARATELTNRLPELTRALEARGFDTPELQVRSAMASGSDNELFAMASASSDSLVARAVHDVGGARNDGRSTPDDGPPPRSHHHHNRHRSRRDRGGDTQ